MKRTICCIICLIAILSFTSCNSDPVRLHSGNYYAVGDYEEFLTPYFRLDTSQNRFYLGAGSIVSYAEYGTYRIVGSRIIATSQSTTFVFEIKDTNTLVLVDNGDNHYFKLPVNTQFVFSEDLT